MKILIVEDDISIAELLCDSLKDWGYEAKYIKDFLSITEQVAKIRPHLVLLDVKLPFHNGFYWCKEIRNISNIPIIFISSNSDKMNMVMAMNMGADDYITKPFDISVLVAKIQALLRRTYTFQKQNNMIEYHGLILLIDENAISYNGKKVGLTKNEFKILELLLKNKGCPISKKDLMMKLWNDDYFVSDNTLFVNIARLRKTLENIGLPELIVTKKGIGYMVNE